jgi:uncharacterized protein (TIGR03083 family)
MVDEHDLEGLDPYDLMAAESARLERFFSSVGDDGWATPSRCEGWSVRDVLAHLVSTEDYNQACLEGTAQQFLAGVGAKGAVDLASANEIGIRELDDRTPEQLLELWRARSAENREGFRARDGADVDSSVGAYPARWQAFHLAFELATHADDVFVPVAPAEAGPRNAWQARFGRFALREAKPDLAVGVVDDGRTHVQGEGVDVQLTDDQFVPALAARLPAGSGLDAAAATALSVTP